jgi:protein tyrosine phosphatase (PTP) superfamily phosphohydrolase (DUF442 family)
MDKQTKQLARSYLRVVQDGYRAMRRSITKNAPLWLGRSVDPFLDHFDLIFLDHGILRLVYPNRHRLSVAGWRSAQPAPHDIRVLTARGLRTVVNLRGVRDCGSYRLERQACQRHGVRLIDFAVGSREAPPARIFHEAKALFDSIEYPMLLHCKSGADRVGLMSTLYMILKEGMPVAEARRQLSLRFGHIRQADTGVLGTVFDSYLTHNSREPVSFLEWVDRHYDDKAIGRRFRANSWANLVVNKVMRRE